jgi:osmoprotectant transport system ATP-binding protein
LPDHINNDRSILHEHFGIYFDKEWEITMITFENVTKIYPGSDIPAVADLSFTVPEGETCVIIGPSGCGKTTSLKMINRLIEPSGGKLVVNGLNVLEQNPVELRRNIGYVIQQIGLFPHMTVRDNIAVVPRLLNWDESRIDDRVDELISMVNMDPGQFRDRFPRELSGGQRQRIGVVRALAADPPVLLMDEPFGAIDPINRDALQNEFLRLQKRLKKTIAFVTHDIDEALKMGSMICILQVGGELVQYDTPENILANPVDEFVTDFVGADRGLKRLNLVRVSDVMKPGIGPVQSSAKASEAITKMQQHKVDNLLVVDDENRLVGYITLKAAEKMPDQPVSSIIHEAIAVTEEEATMKDAFSEMLSHGIAYMPVLGDKNKLLGVVSAIDAQQLIQESGE